MSNYGQISVEMEIVSEDVVTLPESYRHNMAMWSHSGFPLDAELGLDIPIDPYDNVTRSSAYRQWLMRQLVNDYANLGGDMAFTENDGYLPGVHFEGYAVALMTTAQDIAEHEPISIINPDGSITHFPIGTEVPLWVDRDRSIMFYATHWGSREWTAMFVQIRKYAKLPLTTTLLVPSFTYIAPRPEDSRTALYRTAPPVFFSYLFIRPRPVKEFIVTTSRDGGKPTLSLAFYNASRELVFETDTVELETDCTCRTSFKVNVPRGGYVHVKTRQNNILSIETIPRLI